MDKLLDVGLAVCLFMAAIFFSGAAVLVYIEVYIRMVSGG